MSILTFSQPQKVSFWLFLVLPFWKSDCLLWTAFFLQCHGRKLRLAKPNNVRNAPSYKRLALYFGATAIDTHAITPRVPKVEWGNLNQLRQLYVKSMWQLAMWSSLLWDLKKMCEFTTLRSWSNQRIHYSEIFFWSPCSLWVFTTYTAPLPYQCFLLEFSQGRIAHLSASC